MLNSTKKRRVRLFITVTMITFVIQIKLKIDVVDIVCRYSILYFLAQTYCSPLPGKCLLHRLISKPWGGIGLSLRKGTTLIIALEVVRFIINLAARILILPNSWMLCYLVIIDTEVSDRVVLRKNIRI